MPSNKNLRITFHLEPADRSVGIMAEGFSAWEENGTSWCDCTDVAKTFDRRNFTWYDNETGNACEAPANGRMIEEMLFTWIAFYYDGDGDA